jgi:diguanylate cyclase (GGDEF)-like protein
MNYKQLTEIRKNVRTHIDKKDKLTGIYNKQYFFNYISNKPNGTVIRINVDGVNFVNVNYGMEIGDTLMQFIAICLEENCNCENAVIARLSNFDFIIHQTNTNNERIYEFMEEIKSILTQEVKDIYKVYINFNIAAVIYKDDDLDVYDSINKLDICMKNLISKGNRVGIYNDTYEDHITIQSIEDGIKSNEIKLYYQPKIDLNTDKIVGVEVLIRWFSIKHGYIHPEKIISFAEDCRYINILGKWILETSCIDINYLNEVLNTNIDLSVNISPLQLEEEDFIKDVIEILKSTKFDFKSLKLEITESENIEDIIKINDIIDNIKKTGIKISIDDFGKGFNSINYIKNYNVDEIKIDKSLVEYSNRNPMFVESLINMIHTTQTTVVAEGVETEKEYLRLKNMGCDLVQGYYFYKPMDLNSLIEALKEEKYRRKEELTIG